MRTHVPSPPVIAPMRDAERLLCAAWFKAEWPEYFADTLVAAIAGDLFPPQSGGSLPRVWCASVDGVPCGTIALRATGIADAPLPGPWVGGLLVLPEYRRRGIGAALIKHACAEAAASGYTQLSSATAVADSLLQRLGWERVEEIVHDGAPLRVYRYEV